MPIMPPLADIIGLSRQTAVLAFQFGDGFTNAIIPTHGTLCASLGVAGIPFNKWFKFALPVVAVELVRQMYEHPELGVQEVLASGLHTAILERHGFTVRRELCGFPTGYRADYAAAKPGPHVAFLAEFDALPDLGHGCGHNLVGACALGAGAALKSVLDELGGRVTVYGAPEEETSGGKVAFAEAGEFDGVDLAILCHPGNSWARSGSSLALEPVQFEFFGKPSHAASAPEQGINALDAALVTMNAINALREHVRTPVSTESSLSGAGRPTSSPTIPRSSTTSALPGRAT